jgi:hypothetical protein
VTLKFPPLFAVPAGVVTWSLPVVAPAGTTVSILVEEITVKEALVALKTTAVAPVKLEPRMVTAVPTGPLAGLNEVIFGGLTYP